ncbi:MAG TPA: hypothetical protein PLK35_03920 [Candidatus Moranbacteria bacterium]|nr:hypothetical protein [Candidatus Moranbacteria bacterium]
MKTKILFSVAVVMAVFVFSGCQKEELNTNKDNQTKHPEMTESEAEIKNETGDKNEANLDYSVWQAYNNEKYAYQIRYPSDWFFLKDNCCPPPPASVNFNNISDKKEIFVQKQTDPKTQSISIDCLYEGKIDDIGEVALQKQEGKTFENKKVNNFDAIVFNKDRGPGQPMAVFTWYIVDGQQGCRLTYDSNCTVCRSIISSFNFKK